MGKKKIARIAKISPGAVFVIDEINFFFSPPNKKAVRLLSQLGVYFILVIVSWIVIRYIRARAPADDDQSVYAKLARFFVLGYEPTTKVTSNLDGEEAEMQLKQPPAVKKKPAAVEGDGNSDTQRSTATQFFLITYVTFGLMFSYLAWGVLQERVMTTEYATGKFESSNFLVFSNRIFALLVAVPMITYKNEGLGRAPFYKYAFTSLSNTLSSWCQLEALKFVSFPVQGIVFFIYKKQVLTNMDSVSKIK